MATNPKCSNCKRYFEPTLKSSGLFYKTCENCRICTKKSTQDTKCEHNRRKSQCKDCKGCGICEHNKRRNECIECEGSQICEHKILKKQCKKCKGSQICEHNRRKSNCKECGNVMKKIINTMIYSSKATDKKTNRLDIVNFIDTDFCKLLIEESNNRCCYCNCELELIHYGSNLITIERINNNLGHIKSNVKISCLSCNSKRVGKEIN